MRDKPAQTFLVSSISYRKFLKIFFFLFILNTYYLILNTVPAYADDTNYSFANYLPVQDHVVKNGDIISFSPKGYFLSRVPYDAFAVGVVDTNPAISIEVSGPTKNYPVVSSGNALVNVTTMNGLIKKGDPVTPSKVPGAGMKGTKSGYMIGIAQEDYINSNTKAIGQIPVTINVHYIALKGSINSGLLDIFNLSTIATYEQPLQVLRYVIAAVIIIASFTFGFFSFARTANKGLEALGRNPLASRIIHIGILLNIMVTIGIILGGLIVSFIVIRL